jgi:hypothetical protein
LVSGDELEKRMIAKESIIIRPTQFKLKEGPQMTIAQIEDQIRSLRPSERIELYKWLDYMVVADCGVDTSFCSRLGVDRALEIRHTIVSKSCEITARNIL